MKRPTSRKSFPNIKQIDKTVHVNFYIIANAFSMLRLHRMEWKYEEMGAIKHEMNRYLRKSANG